MGTVITACGCERSGGGDGNHERKRQRGGSVVTVITVRGCQRRGGAAVAQGNHGRGVSGAAAGVGDQAALSINNIDKAARSVHIVCAMNRPLPFGSWLSLLSLRLFHTVCRPFLSLRQTHKKSILVSPIDL